MRIDSMVYTNQVYGPKNARRSPYAAQTGQTKDALEISDFGNAYQVAKQAAKGTEPVREDRVKEIKAQLENGTYNVPLSAVAEKMAAQLLG
ncbi:MAG: flagellar biosynthesis anti-sigma factor FlgM [Eubacterium sp.]|nr:flagellar biosynthesis anti-sigma factor FlgM [Eubacterium sp.]